MGKASSAKRARASAAKLNPARRNTVPVPWIIVGALVVGLGVLVVVVSRGGDNTPPNVHDHWHVAFGVNVCGQWADVAGQPNSAESQTQVAHSPVEFTKQFSNTNLYAGVHTHHDGVIHIEPQTAVDTGKNVTLGRFFHYGGWKLDGSGFDLSTGYQWPGPAGMKAAYHDGDKCPNGKVGHLVWSVKHVNDKTAKTMTGNPAKYKLADLDVVAVGFLTSGQKLGEPPSSVGFGASSVATSSSVPTASTTETTAPGATTVPPATTAAAPTTTP